MAGATYAVIGSNCFTGAHIVDDLLHDAARVVGLSRSPEPKDFFLPYRSNPHRERFEFHQLDLVRQSQDVIDLLDAVKPDVVVNVAALSEVGLSNTSPVEYFQINTTAVVRLCNALRTREYLRRYVHISSAEIFGSCEAPLTEEALFNPSTPYAVSKAAADMYLHTLQRNFGFPATLIRSTNVFGRHQQLFKIIPRAAIFVKQGKTIELHGGGTSAKCFVHVRDVADGVRLAIERGRPGTYHFTVASDRTVADTVRYVCDRLGVAFERATRLVNERLGQDAKYLLDPSKAAAELGWKPRVTFEQGVDETLEWIDANWTDIQREPLAYQHKI